MSDIRFDTSKLRGRIFEKYKTLKEFANDLGLNTATATNKVNGKTQWKANEIYCITVLLGIPQSDFGLYFFTPAVGKTQQEA